MNRAINLELVLERVNQARVAIGKEPLSQLRTGVPDDGGICPLANSLDGGGVVVDYWGAVFDTEEEAARVRVAWGVGFDSGIPNGAMFPDDEDIARFPVMFDAGELPEFLDDSQ